MAQSPRTENPWYMQPGWLNMILISLVSYLGNMELQQMQNDIKETKADVAIIKINQAVTSFKVDTTISDVATLKGEFKQHIELVGTREEEITLDKLQKQH